jgi:hypothetical protein
MINDILIAVYWGIGIASGVVAYIDSEPEDKGSKAYIVGIILGSIMWPIAVIVAIIDGIKKHKDNKEKEEA